MDLASCQESFYSKVDCLWWKKEEEGRHIHINQMLPWWIDSVYYAGIGKWGRILSKQNRKIPRLIFPAKDRSIANANGVYIYDGLHSNRDWETDVFSSFFSLLLVATRNKKSTYFMHSSLFETIEQPDQSVARLFGIHPIPYCCRYPVDVFPILFYFAALIFFWF
jgi:hypothetical protein